MSFYSNKVHIFSGLLSRMSYRLQHGLREIAAQVGDTSFHPSMSGYEDWGMVAGALAVRKPKSCVLLGHSNGGYAVTKIAEQLKPKGILCYICVFDRTLKPCPRLGSNVPEAIDIWAGLQTLKPGHDFTGNLTLMDFGPETHVSVIENEHAQRIAIAFARKWKL